MDRISDQTRQLRGHKDELATIKSALKEMGEHNSKIAKVEYDKAMKDLKSLKVQAMEVDDYERIVDVDEQIQDLKEAKQEVPPEETKPKAVHPDIEAWMKENQWYGRDVIMRGAADSISQEYMNMNPSSKDNPKEVLEYVERVMREEFPHKFEGKTQRRRPAATSEVSEPMSRSTGKEKYTYKDLNEMQRGFCNTFVESGVFKTKQEYVDQLVATGDIDKQRGL